jgi:hypothetical protein
MILVLASSKSSSLVARYMVSITGRNGLKTFEKSGLSMFQLGKSSNTQTAAANMLL